MSAMLQNLHTSQVHWPMPADPAHGTVKHGLLDAAAQHATLPWAESPDTRFARWSSASNTSSPKDQEFIEFLDAYRGSGGLARTHEIVGMLKRCDAGDTEQLARWIVNRQVISIEWQSQTWFPWFQFERALGWPKSVVGKIARELCTVLDDWEIMRWFAQPNPWLDDSTPAENLTSQPAVLLEAARASRFLAKG